MSLQNTAPVSLPAAARGLPHAVLLVDPHEDTRNLYAVYLKLEGCEVEMAEDGREALAKALTNRYDAIITETRLPGIDGYQLCNLLRHDPATLQTRIVFVTGDARTSDQARLAGADAVLIKPCLPETIIAELRRVSAGDGAAKAAGGSAAGTQSTPAASRTRRAILSRVHQRGSTTTPSAQPPTLHCPMCDKILVYESSYLGGVSMRHPEQWDYFACPGPCGRFEYRQRTRKIRRVETD